MAANGGYTRNGTGVTIIRAPKDGTSLEQLADALHLLADVEVLVGVPEETTDHRDEPDDDDNPITNAALAAIHNEGAPEVNIPARPFMQPGIFKVRDNLAKKLRRVATVALKTRDPFKIEAAMHEIGLTAQLSIQNTLREGVPPPLADSTLRERARKRKGRIGPGLELLSRSKGNAPGVAFVKPLIDTGDLLKSISYVIRSRKRRKR